MVKPAKPDLGSSSDRFREVAAGMGYEKEQIEDMFEAARELTRNKFGLSWHDDLPDVMYRTTQDEDLIKSLYEFPPHHC